MRIFLPKNGGFSLQGFSMVEEFSLGGDGR